MRRNKIVREVNGFLLLDKPSGRSSNSVLQEIKKLYQAKKAGHTGTLDPLASGMLIICFGSATKYSQYFLNADKTYIATGRLGIKTSTADAEGEILERKNHFTISKENLIHTLKEFTGVISQVPSMFSALKHQGKPLYQYARAGLTVPRPAREVTIYDLQLLNYQATDFEIKICCSKGTYIRNLIEDIGDKLEVGAYVKELRRLSYTGLTAARMYRLEECYDKNWEQLDGQLLAPEELPTLLQLSPFKTT